MGERWLRGAAAWPEVTDRLLWPDVPRGVRAVDEVAQQGGQLDRADRPGDVAGALHDLPPQSGWRAGLSKWRG